MTPPLIKAHNLNVSFEGRRIFSDVSFCIHPKEIVTIVGPNGSGKSTCLKALIGALTPNKGSIHKKPDLRIGYVPQKLDIDPSLPLTVQRFLNLPKRTTPSQITQALQTVGLQEYHNAQISTLSGGQRQNIFLARAILHTPHLLILDEPTQGLDQAGTANFYKLIEHLKTNLGCAVLMVSHELHVVMSASDRVICLNGHICCEGTPDVVRSAPAYRELFGTGTKGTMALYRHEHHH